MPASLEIRVGEPVELDAELASGRLRVRVRRREVGDDGGVSIELAGATGGEPTELLRFDLFRRDPHYHVPASDPAQIDLDPARDGEPLEFALTCIRERLRELLDRAKSPELARAVEASAASALADLAERVRAAVTSAPEPSSSYRIELDPAAAEPPRQT
jgi:hypothetical protein